MLSVEWVKTTAKQNIGDVRVKGDFENKRQTITKRDILGA